MGRLKLLITTPEFPPKQWGGLSRTVERVARHASGLGLETHVACFEIEPTSYVLLDENVEICDYQGIRLYRIKLASENILESERGLWDCPHNLTLQMMYQTIEKLDISESFDLFHSFFLYPVGYVTGLIAKRRSRPAITTVVGNDVKKYIFSPEKSSVCKSGLDNADMVVGLSDDLIEMADALTPIRSKSRVIFNSVVIPENEWNKERAEEIRIGAAGIFKYAKGLPYLFKAVERLSAKYRISLSLKGQLRDSEIDIYHYILNRTGISDIVETPTPLNHEKIPEWIMSLDVFCLPSLTEGCPNILMEAMSCGAPCVATRTGACERLIDHGHSGLLANWGDSDALADCLEDLILNEALAREMGRSARKKMAGFTEEFERTEWSKVYDSFVK